MPTKKLFSKIKKHWTILKTTVKEFMASDPTAQAATIAYYTIFSLPAVMIIAIMVAASFYDEAAVRNALLTQAGKMIGPDTAASLREMMENAAVTESKLLAEIMGIAALVISAGSVFASLQAALNRVWEVEATKGKAVWKYLSTRLLSLALVASFGFLMLVSLLLDAALVAFGERLSNWLSGFTAVLVTTLNVTLSFSIITFIFAMIFKVLPDAKIRWRDVLSGSVVTALLFTLGKYLIGLYISYAGVGDSYGAAGAVVIILVWVYYSTVILLFGAHFTHVYARDYGTGVKPSDHADKRIPIPTGAT
ncbi:MAG: YihY/virulence factor BrkB family protein [Flavobacteriales bacterium]|nr:YihY/virulence factor BrkB family protein [Flavobacteriales bacterium]